MIFFFRGEVKQSQAAGYTTNGNTYYPEIIGLVESHTDRNLICPDLVVSIDFARFAGPEWRARQIAHVEVCILTPCERLKVRQTALSQRVHLGAANDLFVFRKSFPVWSREWVSAISSRCQLLFNEYLLAKFDFNNAH